MVQAGKEHVEEKYEGFRDAARGHTLSQIYTLAKTERLPIFGLNLSGIDDQALKACEGWNFPWRRIVGQTRPYLRRFEIAIWQYDTLLAVGIGRASRGPDNITLHFLERNSANNPLAGYVILVTVAAAESYAKIICRQYVKLKSVHPALIAKYESLGFSLERTYRGVTYYARRVGL